MRSTQGSYSNPLKATWKGLTDRLRPIQEPVRLAEEDRVDGLQALVIGASSGLGLEAAVQLVQRGAHVWMACRSGIPEKGEFVRRRAGSERVSMLPVDLSDLDSVEGLVALIREKGIRFDIVVENAAVVTAGSRRTRQGLDEMFVVNYLSKYLLVRRLIEEDLLRTDAARIPRIVYVASESHRNPRSFEWDRFGRYREYGIGATVAEYGYTKWLLVTMARTLSRRLNPDERTRISVFALCPGPVDSRIARESPRVFQPVLKMVFRLFFRSPARAVKPVIYLACSPEVEGRAADYLFLMGRKKPDARTMTVAHGDRLWQLSEALLHQLGYGFAE